MLVAYVHTGDLLFVSYHDPTPLNKTLHFLIMQGGSAVLAFFVLSGYLVSLSLLDKLDAIAHPFRRYVLARLCRLHVVLIPALFLCLFWDKLGMALFGTDNVYGGISLGSHCVPDSVDARLGFPIFMGNVFNLQEILVPSLGSNGVLWSLSCEFWYYVIFPLLVFALLPRSKDTWTTCKKFLCAVLALGSMCFIGSLMSWRFVIWLTGAAILLLPVNKGIKNKRLFNFFFVLAVCVFYFRLWIPFMDINPLLSEILLAITCALCIYVSLHDRMAMDGAFSKMYKKATEWLASFAYTLYLVHVPFLFFFRAMLIGDERWPVDAEHLFYAVCIFALVILYAWIVAQFTERHTHKVRGFLAQKLERIGISRS